MWTPNCVATTRWNIPACTVPIARRLSFSFSLGIALRPLSTTKNTRFSAYRLPNNEPTVAKSTKTSAVRCSAKKAWKRPMFKKRQRHVKIRHWPSDSGAVCSLLNCAKYQAKVLSGVNSIRSFLLHSHFSPLENIEIVHSWFALTVANVVKFENCINLVQQISDSQTYWRKDIVNRIFVLRIVV